MKSRVWKRLLQKLASVFVAAAVMCSTACFAGAVTQEEIDGLTAQKNEIESQLEACRSQLSELDDQENTAVKQALVYQSEISLLANQIADSEAAIAEYDELIEQTEEELNTAKNEEAQYFDLYCERVRGMEEVGPASYWGVIFNATDFNDFVDRYTLISEVIDYDQSVEESLRNAKEQVQAKETELKQQREEQENLLTELEAQKAEIQSASDSNNALLEEIRNNQDIYASEISELSTESGILDQSIEQSQEAYAAQVVALLETSTDTSSSVNENSSAASSAESSTEQSVESSTESTDTSSQEENSASSSSADESSDSSSGTWTGEVLTRYNGTVMGPSGKETYYNLDMSYIVERMHYLGYEGEYWVREDGCKMLGDYIMVAANLSIRPLGTILETSLGTAIVCDTGGFAITNPYQIDIATNW